MQSLWFQSRIFLSHECMQFGSKHVKNLVFLSFFGCVQVYYSSYCEWLSCTVGFGKNPKDWYQSGISQHIFTKIKTQRFWKTRHLSLSFIYIQVFLVGKDFGSPVANFIALLHPKRVLGVITLGVPFMPPRPPTHHNGLPEGFYISRWRVFL